VRVLVRKPVLSIVEGLRLGNAVWFLLVPKLQLRGFREAGASRPGFPSWSLGTSDIWILLVVLVPKLRLGNAAYEAPASWT